MNIENYMLKIENASKKFGKKVVLDNLCLNLQEGKVLGLLGPNGAGKTTLLKAIVGLVKLDAGNIYIDGHKPGVESKKIVSYLPDSNYIFEGFDVKDCINLFDDFFDDFNHGKCDKLLSKMNISKSQKLSEMSKGYVERLNVALVMSRDAKLFVLDEPLAGVDPLAREMILDAIIDSIGDSTMIVTTQLIDSMSKIFDEVCYLDDGKIILRGESDLLIEQKGKMLEDIYKDLYR